MASMIDERNKGFFDNFPLSDNMLLGKADSFLFLRSIKLLALELILVMKPHQ